MAIKCYTPFICLLAAIAVIIGCGGSAAVDEDRPNANAPYILKEMVATGDTGMTRFSGIKTVNELNKLCQHWELAGNEGATSAELVEDEDNDRMVPGLDLFTDSSFVENPRGHFTTGTWRIRRDDQQLILVLTSINKKEKTWTISEFNSGSLRLTTTSDAGSTLYLNLSADGMVHRNKLNDPFHPVNNQWRIKPAQRESDSAIALRAKQCVKFYALFYRDNILRQKDKINFFGLPEIFEWYSRGIGMPDWEDIQDSWVNCFYDKEQARKGYGVLRELIVNYEFNWPKGAPDWRMETESVLEQMYLKMK
ncbi:hypothetical protein HB364_11035 [Pseudoflavitalea sp. X16]|uniref:hypothetical protein n=1 Tax=Paraflavitalea devenefica TaxID=2716334 RepID=UPI001420CC35|nr:hypothetical protein [Paraflavitalea devenefica]NII25620.1 hypothetical protein [Paraflavitalea devenefica]